jgi:hypothetical protein
MARFSGQSAVKGDVCAPTHPTPRRVKEETGRTVGDVRCHMPKRRGRLCVGAQK